DKGDLLLTSFSIAAVRTANSELECEIYNGYAAPEQYSVSERQGTWTDVYGVCAVIYRVLTGSMPPSAISRMENDNLVAPSVLNPNVPRHVSNVIMQGLSLNSGERIQTVTELVTLCSMNIPKKKTDTADIRTALNRQDIRTSRATRKILTRTTAISRTMTIRITRTMTMAIPMTMPMTITRKRTTTHSHRRQGQSIV
ncbi:MAG: hypothetical protein ACLR5S_09210, partial [Ruminococcus sp.]